MKISVVQSGSGDPTWSHTVRLIQGVQSFNLDYKSTREECEWYAQQFQQALDAHVEEFKTALAEGYAIVPLPTAAAPTDSTLVDSTTIVIPTQPGAELPGADTQTHSSVLAPVQSETDASASAAQTSESSDAQPSN
jgi:hypothetical protein